MQYSLPYAVEIDGKTYNIRNQCDYRMVLDVIECLNDNELPTSAKLECALFIFYEDIKGCTNLQKATEEMLNIINYGETEEKQQTNEPVLMNWQKDFKQIAPPISKNLGYDVRTPNKYTHWWTFLGAYMEIGECTFSTIVSIRRKRAKGQKLDKWEQDFVRENYNLISLPNENDSWLDEED